jgi:hypothetical protein
VAVDGDVGRRGAQARYLGVVAHPEVERGGSATVGAVRRINADFGCDEATQRFLSA